jgi:DHA3 family macrolide efflux protein-like MFS transporter
MNINWKKNTALFLTGQAFSLFGTMVVQCAIIWHITLKSQSGTMITLFTLAVFLPMFFISPFAGVWADRFNRKNIINIADGSIAFFSLVVALLLIFGIDSYWILLFCTLVRSFGQGIQTPAVGAFIPQIVPVEQLTKVNGIQNSIQSLVTLTSPMISGVLIAFTPLQTLFFLDVITAIIGISIVFFFVKLPTATNNTLEQERIPWFHGLKEGICCIKKHGFVLQMFIISAIYYFLIAPCAFLTPLQVTRDFGNEVWRLSAIEVAFSGGIMLGGILMVLWSGFKNRIYTMTLSLALSGLLTAGLGITSNFWVYLFMMTILGITLPLWNVPSMVLLQTTIETNFMGRVLSVFNMITSTMMPLGMIVFGPVSDFVSIDILLIGTGILITLLTFPVLTSKTLLNAGKS